MVGARGEALTRTLDLLAELLGANQRQAIDDALGSATVTIRAPEANLEEVSTQAAVYVLASLLVRSGVRVALDLPPAGRRIALPGLELPDFRDALGAALLRMFPADGASARIGDGTQVRILVGGGGAVAPTDLSMLADDQAAQVLRGDASAAAIRWDPGGLSAIAAAGLAAGEALKDILRPVAKSHIEVLDALEPSFEVGVVHGGELDLGHLVVVSAGAITQQLLLVLAATTPKLSARIDILDGDETALSNTNRSPFVFIDRLGIPKVTAVQGLIDSDRFVVDAHPEHLSDTSAHLIRPGSVVIVGADDIAVRHLAQQLDPDWLAIGATSHSLALVTEHPAGEACAGCAHHDLGEEIEIIPTWSIVSFWAGYLLALRIVARANGTPYRPDRRMMTLYPLRPNALFEHELAFSPRCPINAPSCVRQVPSKESSMSEPQKPGEKPVRSGPYHETGPRGGQVRNPREVKITPDDGHLPPTRKPDRTWTPGRKPK